MIKGFPKQLVSYIQCCANESNLLLDKQFADDEYLLNANLTCTECGKRYSIKEGILDMVEQDTAIDKTSLFEMKTRDSIASKYESNIVSDLIAYKMEVPSTIGRLGDLSNKLVLEVGCGTGRLTKVIANKSNMILAVDFSRQSLLLNANSLPSYANVGLLRQNITDLKLRENIFDLALSTLYSNLPSKILRKKSTKVVYDALKKGGKYVFSAHHYDLTMKKNNQPDSGTYDNGIFFQTLTKKSLKEEIYEFFPASKIIPICIWLPLISRLSSIRVFVSRIAEHIPVLNNYGALLLVVATKKQSL